MNYTKKTILNILKYLWIDKVQNENGKYFLNMFQLKMKTCKKTINKIWIRQCMHVNGYQNSLKFMLFLRFEKLIRQDVVWVLFFYPKITFCIIFMYFGKQCIVYYKIDIGFLTGVSFRVLFWYCIFCHYTYNVEMICLILFIP